MIGNEDKKSVNDKLEKAIESEIKSLHLLRDIFLELGKSIKKYNRQERYNRRYSRRGKRGKK